MNIKRCTVFLTAAFVLGMFSPSMVFAQKFLQDLNAIKALEPGTYTITLTEDVTLNTVFNREHFFSFIDFTGFEGKTIIIQGDSQRRAITRSTERTLFAVRNNVSIILGNNITLNGNSKASDIVIVHDGGKLEMRNGAEIRGNSGCGIAVNGTFNMTGGTIRDNKTNQKGGGVNVYGGIFSMSGGIISGNTSIGDMAGGGGVAVLGSGTFIMIGGTISGNTSSAGGGVYVSNGTFNMLGGTINNNYAHDGGGLCIYSGTFIKTGGSIDNSNQAVLNGNIVSGDIIRNSIAGPNVNLDSRISGAEGGWE